MPLIETPPPIILLERVKLLLNAVDWLDRTGIEGMKWRHARNRAPLSTERPVGSIGFAGDDDFPDAPGSARNAWETVRRLQIDLQVDLRLPTEASDLDPTGWLLLMRVQAAAFEALTISDDEGGQEGGLYGFADDVIRDEASPNEDSSSDDGRLVQGISVIYRVSTARPNRLLGSGV